MCVFPFESIAIEEYLPDDSESMTREGIGPPELVGIAFGDIAVLLMRLNEL